MKTKKPILMSQGHTDEIYTPKYALYPLIPFLKKGWIIRDCAWGKGHLAKNIAESGFNCVGNESKDFFNLKKEDLWEEDILITNPPYSKKDEFLQKAYELDMPFAFLMPLTALEGIKRGKMYKENGIQLIIPNRRINFITPNGGKSAWFQVAWFCYKLNLPKDIMFIELNRNDASCERGIKNND